MSKFMFSKLKDLKGMLRKATDVDDDDEEEDDDENEDQIDLPFDKYDEEKVDKMTKAVSENAQAIVDDENFDDAEGIFIQDPGLIKAMTDSVTMLAEVIEDNNLILKAITDQYNQRFTKVDKRLSTLDELNKAVGSGVVEIGENLNKALSRPQNLTGLQFNRTESKEATQEFTLTKAKEILEKSDHPSALQALTEAECARHISQLSRGTVSLVKALIKEEK